jgi:hypothetical protein
MVEPQMDKASGTINGAVFQKIEGSSDLILSEVVEVS